MLDCVFMDDMGHIEDELNFYINRKNVKSECSNLCPTLFPFTHDILLKTIKNEKKIKWKEENEIVTTYSRDDYDRKIDKERISQNLFMFRRWYLQNSKMKKTPRKEKLN